MSSTPQSWHVVVVLLSSLFPPSHLRLGGLHLRLEASGRWLAKLVIGLGVTALHVEWLSFVLPYLPRGTQLHPFFQFCLLLHSLSVSLRSNPPASGSSFCRSCHRDAAIDISSVRATFLGVPVFHHERFPASTFAAKPRPVFRMNLVRIMVFGCAMVSSRLSCRAQASVTACLFSLPPCILFPDPCSTLTCVLILQDVEEVHAAGTRRGFGVAPDA